MTTEQDYRRGYAQGYAAAANDAKSARLKRFLLQHITPWRHEPNPDKSAPPKIATPCGGREEVRAALAKELENWGSPIIGAGIDRLADVAFGAAK